MRWLTITTALLSMIVSLSASAEDVDLSRRQSHSPPLLSEDGSARQDARAWSGSVKARGTDIQDVSQLVHQVRASHGRSGARALYAGAAQGPQYFARGRDVLPYDSGSQSSSSGNKPQMSEQEKMIIMGVLSVVFIILINGIRLGLTDKMIFYENWWDVFLTVLVWLLPAGLLLGSAIVAGQTDPNSEVARLNQEFKASQVLLIAAAASWPLMVVIVFIKNIRLNGFGFGSMSVFLAKLTLSFLLFFSWGRWNDTSKTLDARLNALFLFTLLAAFTARLVNGEEVKHTRLVEVTG